MFIFTPPIAVLALADLLGFVLLLQFFREKGILDTMGTKAAELAALLKGKSIFHVNIEEPDNQGSIVETLIQDPQGVIYSVEGNIFKFTGNGKTVPFTVLETAQIVTNQTEKGEIIVTFAENGGVQISMKN